jgi:SAM-dependent methyltransferase
MAVYPRSSRSSATLDRWLESLARRWPPRSSPRRSRVELGDFGRRSPSLEREEVSVYDALVRRFLRPRLAAFAPPGLVLGVDAEPGWTDVLPAAADVKVIRATSRSEHELAAAATVDWVVLDRCLQWLPEMAVALEEVVGRLRPGTALVTFFTGIARPEPGECAPLWSVAPYAARRLLEERRELERVDVEQYGNVTLALAWIHRLAAGDLTERELAAVDPAYPVLVAVTASRRGRRG